jgi:hypothetical protein
VLWVFTVSQALFVRGQPHHEVAGMKSPAGTTTISAPYRAKALAGRFLEPRMIEDDEPKSKEVNG